MARPRKSDKERRSIQRITRYNLAEDALLLKRAEAANMDVSDFTRETSLRRRFTPRPSLAEVDFLLYVRGEIGRAGNNLNQLVQRLNATNLLPTVEAAQTVITQMQDINTEVLRLLRHGYSREKQG